MLPCMLVLPFDKLLYTTDPGLSTFCSSCPCRYIITATPRLPGVAYVHLAHLQLASSNEKGSSYAAFCPTSLVLWSVVDNLRRDCASIIANNDPGERRTAGAAAISSYLRSVNIDFIYPTSTPVIIHSEYRPNRRCGALSCPQHGWYAVLYYQRGRVNLADDACLVRPRSPAQAHHTFTRQR